MLRAARVGRGMIPLPKGTIDETGHRYGRLTVEEYIDSPGAALWRCMCECGSEIVARGSKLRQGIIVSCGCWRADPNVRQAARLKVSARRRKQIASLGGLAAAQSVRVTYRPSVGQG